jgi:hypothetical protein
MPRGHQLLFWHIVTSNPYGVNTPRQPLAFTHEFHDEGVDHQNGDDENKDANRPKRDPDWTAQLKSR